MEYFFPVLVGILAAALVIYIVMTVRDRMQPKREIQAVLIRRERRKNPHQTVFGRHDSVEYRLVFVPADEAEKASGKIIHIEEYTAKPAEKEAGLVEKKKEMPFDVRKEVYRSVPKNVSGKLYYQGSRFLSFTYEDVTVYSYSDEIPFDREIQEKGTKN